MLIFIWRCAQWMVMLLLLALSPFGVESVANKLLGKHLDLTSRLEVWAWPRADVISALSALGAFAAIFAALFLASAETRRRKSEAKQTARLTACAVAMRIGIVRTFMQGALAQVEHGIQCGGMSDDIYFAMEEGLLRQQLCTREELRDMIALRENCAEKIAGATDRMEAAIKFLKSSNLEVQVPSVDVSGVRWKTLLHLQRLFSDADSMLEVAVRICTHESRGIQVALPGGKQSTHQQTADTNR